MEMLYITFIDFDNIGSGSSVRPVMMYNGFKSLGINVKLVQCQQNRRKERKQVVEEALEWLDTNTPDFCYIEPPSGPFFNFIDIKLMKKVKAKNIPMALFYRDFHWKYPEFGGKKPFVKGNIIKAMHIRDLYYFRKLCNLIYFPGPVSLRETGGLGCPKTGILPPGGHDCSVKTDNFNEKNYLYLGGTSEEYGGIRLINIFQEINKEGVKANLIFVVKKDPEIDFDAFQYPWLKVIHTYDRQVIEGLYEKATYCLIPFKKGPYMDLASPVKLFEYLGFGMPVISVNCEQIAQVLEENKCGIICDDSDGAIKKAVESTLEDKPLYDQLKANAIKAAATNRWIDRAQQVIDDLEVSDK